MYPALGKTSEIRFLRGFPKDHFLDATRQFNVAVGDCSHSMSLQLHRHLGISDTKIGMVPGGLRDITNGRYQHNGVGPAWRCEGPPQPVVADFPVRQSSERLPKF